MSHPPTPASSSLPLWIAAACLAAGAWLFCGNTIPALKERTELGRIANELEVLERRCKAAILHAERSGAGGGDAPDLQSLFVAIDERGYTITEFCAAWPGTAGEQPVGSR
jgi:hypothetical protein